MAETTYAEMFGPIKPIQDGQYKVTHSGPAFRAVGYVPVSNEVTRERRNKAEEAKAILFDQLDNPNYSEERRQSIKKFLDQSNIDPLMFDKVLDTLAVSYKPKQHYMEGDEKRYYPTYFPAKDHYSAGQFPIDAAFVSPTKPTEIYVPMSDPAMTGSNVLAHEFAHVLQLLKKHGAFNIPATFGGMPQYTGFLESIKENFPQYKYMSENPTPTYLTDVLGGTLKADTARPEEVMADFSALRQELLSRGVDIFDDPYFDKNLFKNKEHKAALKTVLDHY